MHWLRTTTTTATAATTSIPPSLLHHHHWLLLLLHLPPLHRRRTLAHLADVTLLSVLGGGAARSWWGCATHASMRDAHAHKGGLWAHGPHRGGRTHAIVLLHCHGTAAAWRYLLLWQHAGRGHDHNTLLLGLQDDLRPAPATPAAPPAALHLSLLHRSRGQVHGVACHFLALLPRCLAHTTAHGGMQLVAVIQDHGRMLQAGLALNHHGLLLLLAQEPLLAAAGGLHHLHWRGLRDAVGALLAQTLVGGQHLCPTAPALHLLLLHLPLLHLLLLLGLCRGQGVLHLESWDRHAARDLASCNRSINMNVAA